MTIEQWMRQNPELAYDALSDLPIYCLAERMEDDLALGQYVREKLEARYKDATEATYLPREPDTERMAEARAINADMHRVIG